jgi:hypothetical protein
MTSYDAEFFASAMLKGNVIMNNAFFHLFGFRGRDARPKQTKPKRVDYPILSGLEWVEERVTPTIRTVSLATPDSATTPGTLRYAFTNAQSGDSIIFASDLSGATILLASRTLCGFRLPR